MRQFASFFACIFIGIFCMTSCTASPKEESKIKVDEQVGEKLSLGDQKSDISVFIFTDWFCPACKKLEPTLETLVPKLLKNTRVNFVDIAIHPESQNFINYNLSLLLNNKDDYLKLRQVLNGITDKSKNPSFEEVVKTMNAAGIKYRNADNASLAEGKKYFDDIIQTYSIDRTPMVVIVNTKTKQNKKLTGLKAITEENVQKAIETLRKS